MDKECFREIYNEVIYKYAQELLKIDEESGQKNLHLRTSRVEKVHDYYEGKRSDIRKYFMNLETKPMDRHKIGAVIIYAILKSRLFEIKNRTKRTLPDQIIMANEYLAVYVALSIVESYKYDDYVDALKKKDPEAVPEPIDAEGDWHLVLPKTFHESSKEAYIHNMCKALYYIKDAENIDIFAYANILFLLEVYTNTINNKAK